MDYDLLIVGNGFDLGADFKTNYSDFLDYEGSNGVTNSLIGFLISAYNGNYIINNEWNGFENLICQYLQFIDYFFNDNDNIEYWFSDEDYDFFGKPKNKYFYWKIKDAKKLPNSILSILNLRNALEKVINISSDSNFKSNFIIMDPNGILKEIYFRVFINVDKINATKEYVLNYILNELNEELLDLEKRLKNYIKNITGEAKAPSFIAEHKPKRIVSFNYSESAQKYYNISEDNIAYIHGRVSTNVVIGIEPSMILNQSFDEESNFIKFFKRFRRIYKNCNSNYNNKIINKLSNDSIIAIYGHSLDLSDKSIIKPIFEKKYKQYDIYCYGNQDEYVLKLSKLIGLSLLDELYADNKIKFIQIK